MCDGGGPGHIYVLSGGGVEGLCPWWRCGSFLEEIAMGAKKGKRGFGGGKVDPKSMGLKGDASQRARRLGLRGEDVTGEVEEVAVAGAKGEVTGLAAADLGVRVLQ